MSVQLRFDFGIQHRLELPVEALRPRYYPAMHRAPTNRLPSNPLRVCRRCHRPLRDPESVRIGMGPQCAKEN